MTPHGAGVRWRVMLTEAVRTAVVHHRTFVVTALAVQAVTAALTLPLVALLLRAALAAADVQALTEASLGQVLRDPGALLLLLLLAAVASLAALLSHGVIVLLARDLRAGTRPDLRRAGHELLAVGRRVLGRPLPLLAAYALVLVPLGNLEVAAFISRGVEVPPFIAAELQKTPLGSALWLLGGVVVLVLNLRLILTPVVLLTRDVGVADAMRASLRLTRRRWLGLLALLGGAWLTSAVVLGGGVLLALVTVRAGEALWAPAAPVIAVLALTAVQLLVLLVSGMVVGLVTLCLLALVDPAGRAAADGAAAAGAAADGAAADGAAADGAAADDAAADLVGGSSAPAAAPRSPAAAPPSPARRVVAGVAVVVLLGVTTAAGVGIVVDTESGTTTMVAAHRGVTDDAVENTLESLSAAAALGVDYVELDVQQAGDGGLVVVHDTNLRRIAGLDRAVPDMTTEELTATEVAQRGHRSRIPSFEEFAARAAALDVGLLVELKVHGREEGDYLGDVVAVMDRYGLLAGSRLQTFDPAVVAETAERFPELRVGLLIAFHRGRLDAGAADFVAVEQASYSPGLLRTARQAGVELVVWTVADAATVRELTRAGVDGLITGSPAMALSERARVAAETGVAQRLGDELRALAGWW